MGFSVNTNSQALAALFTLNSSNRGLQAVQQRINTGYKVGTASDNASTFAIAQGMRGDISGLQAVSSNINLGLQTVNMAKAAAEFISNKLADLKNKAVEATQEGVDREKIAEDIKSYLQQIQDQAYGAQFNGVNLLNGSRTASLDVVTSLNRTSSTAVTIATTSVGVEDLRVETLFGSAVSVSGSSVTSGLDVSSFTAASDAVTAIEGVINAVNGSVARIGTSYNQLTAMGDFTKTLTDTLTSGVGNLVDADLAEESAQLQAMQTKQQLGIQALSIANQSTSAVLALFR